MLLLLLRTRPHDLLASRPLTLRKCQQVPKSEGQIVTQDKVLCAAEGAEFSDLCRQKPGELERWELKV